MPHYYVTVVTRMDALLGLRAQINEALAASGEGKLSVNDFIVKASALVRVAEVSVSEPIDAHLSSGFPHDFDAQTLALPACGWWRTEQLYVSCMQASNDYHSSSESL